MKTPALALGLLLFAGAATAQNTTDKTGSVDRLIEQLGDPEYGIRSAAEKALLKRGKQILPQLKATAASTEDVEVKWRAGRLIQQLESKGKPGSGLTRRPAPPGEDGKFIAPLPRGRAFGAEKGLQEILDTLQQSFGKDGLDPMSRKILDRVIKQLRADQGTIRGGWTFEFPKLPRIDIPEIGPGARSGSSSSSGRSMKMSAGPDGVRVETEEIDENGTKKRKIYEAENMEAFQKKHPGVLKSLDPGIRVHSVFEFSKNSPGGIFQGPKTLRTRVLHKDGKRQRIEVETDTDRNGKEAQRQPPTEGKKLGFYVGKLAPSVREYLGLDDGLGLMVDRIAAGTLAEKLKLKAGDIVVKLGSAKIYSTDDVRRGLEAIENDEDVSVKVIRRGQHIVLRLGHEVPAGKVERKRRPLKKR